MDSLALSYQCDSFTAWFTGQELIATAAFDTDETTVPEVQANIEMARAGR
jgi:hypothetical protein